MMTRKTLTAAMLIVAAACVAAFALPTLKITTPDGNDPPHPGGTSAPFDFQYVGMSKFELSGTGSPYLDMTRNAPEDSVRYRGNNTATTARAKMPYRIKFGEKVGLFGKEPAKSWVLLANLFDTTMARNAVAFKLGHILGLEYTPTFQFVNLEICGSSGACSYKGIYMLTEQIQAGEGRVDIGKKKGWLVEFNFYDPDGNDIMFTTSPYALKTFVKSPEVEDADYAGVDIASYPDLTFVQTELNSILGVLNNNTQFNAGAHRGEIDITSYAKYILVQQFLCNLEWLMGTTGSNYAHKDVGGKMTAGPIWDFDVAPTWGFSNHDAVIVPPSQSGYQPPGQSAQPNLNFYRRFFEDEVFRARYRKLWNENKAAIQSIGAEGGFIDSIYNVLKNDIERNFNAYNCNGDCIGMGGNCWINCPQDPCSGTMNADRYKCEQGKYKDWFNKRITHFDTQIGGSVSLGSGRTVTFDVSKDIADEATSVRSIASRGLGIRAAAVKNGLRLKVVDKAVVKIYGLDGKQVRRVNLARGDHTVRMGDLPRGMYMVRVSMDGERRTLRVPVR